MIIIFFQKFKWTHAGRDFAPNGIVNQRQYIINEFRTVNETISIIRDEFRAEYDENFDPPLIQLAKPHPESVSYKYLDNKLQFIFREYYLYFES